MTSIIRACIMLDTNYPGVHSMTGSMPYIHVYRQPDLERTNLHMQIDTCRVGIYLCTVGMAGRRMQIDSCRVGDPGFETVNGNL